MIIVVNALAASTGGAITIVKDFYECVKKKVEVDKNKKWVFLISGSYLVETDNIRIIVKPKKSFNALRRLYFDFISGESLLNKLDADIVVSLQNTNIKTKKSYKITYLHQALPFVEIEKGSVFNKFDRQLMIIKYGIGYFIKKSLRFSDKIVVQSNWLREKLIKQYDLKQEDIIVSLPSIHSEKVISKNKVFQNNLIQFLYPTSELKYKNNEILYKAYHLLDEEEQKKIQILLTTENTREDYRNIKHIGYLNKNNLNNLYSNSILVYPSKVESFGLPLIEAANKRAYILAADTEYAKETLKGYKKVVYFNPDNAKELADVFRRIINQRQQYFNDCDDWEFQSDNWINLLSLVDELR